jgi:ATP-dependent RNA helicase RhlE
MIQENKRESTQSFYGLGIAPNLLHILDSQRFTTPTPIQVKAIPIAIEGKDLIGIAQTGTGKTLAFALPILQRLASMEGVTRRNPEGGGGQALIVLPTRELALQVDEMVQKIGRSLNVRTAIVIGGASMNIQIQALRRNPQIVIGTPGRILDLLQGRTLHLGAVRILVLDEADRMLDMGFAPQIKKILASLPRERQTMLFSATMPDDIVRIASTYMKLPLRIEIARAGTPAEHVSQELFVVKKEDKIRLLDHLLAEYRGTVLVFSRTKHGAHKICRAIRGMGTSSAEIHSNKSLSQRREALDGFKSGKYRVLVATDIAARGIDVTGIELVVNFDIPEYAEDYVHRIGRTGRAGLAGRAITFATPEQRGHVRAIERLVRTALASSKLPVLPAHRPMPALEASRSAFESARPAFNASLRNFRSRRRPPSRSPRQEFGNRRGQFQGRR